MSITIKSDGSVTVETVAEAAEVMRLLNGHRATKAYAQLWMLHKRGAIVRTAYGYYQAK